MKTFISYVPQQEHLSKVHYDIRGNEKLLYGETSFPIIPVINGYAEEGESIKVILLVQDYEFCRNNLKLFEEEFQALCEKKNLQCEGGIRAETVDFSNEVKGHIEAFQKLIDQIEDGDDLYACLTFGSKPAPIVELMALRYARQIMKHTYISCLVYGEVNFREHRAAIYDETALAYLDDIVGMLAAHNDPNPKRTLDALISM